MIDVASLSDTIHVLHAFQKKSEKTARRELALATARLRQISRPASRIRLTLATVARDLV